MKIAITGGIGSGKSHVCRLLEKKGIRIYDCDNAAKRLMHESEDLKSRLIGLVGESAYVEGRLNKKALTDFLMASDANREALDSLVHPAVAQDFCQSGMQWMECAILYESHFDRLVDFVVAITAPEDVRIQRIMQRDHIDKERAKEWIDRQWPQQRVEALADHVIVNDGTADLTPAIDHLIDDIILPRANFYNKPSQAMTQHSDKTNSTIKQNIK